MELHLVSAWPNVLLGLIMGLALGYLLKTIEVNGGD
jgi:uncharacterized membrane-anchored protein YhcB (DUF1043 family)